MSLLHGRGRSGCTLWDVSNEPAIDLERSLDNASVRACSCHARGWLRATRAEPALNRCPFANDGECDEPQGTGLCRELTDTADCEMPTDPGDDRTGPGVCTEERILACHNAWKGAPNDVQVGSHCKNACANACTYGPDSDELRISCEIMWAFATAIGQYTPEMCPVCAAFFPAQ